MCCIRLTSVKHTKNCFARERTEKATVMIKKLNFHVIKMRTLPVKYCFSFFDIGITKKVVQVLKTQKNVF